MKHSFLVKLISFFPARLKYYISNVLKALLWVIRQPLFAWHRLNLYWKISLWFWLAMCFMLITGAVIFTLTINPGNFLAERTALFEELESYSLALDRVGMFKHSPSESLKMVSLSTPFSSKYSQLILINKRTHKAISFPETVKKKSVKNSINVLLKKKNPDVLLNGGLVTVGPILVSLFPGEKYQLFLVKRHQEEVFNRLAIVTQHNPLYLLIGVLASFIFCFALTGYLRKSLQHLQVTVHKIASGDLSARVCKTLNYHGDEIGKLGASVDFMAERLEMLIQQKQRLLRDVSHELRSPLTRLKISNALAFRKAGHIAKAEYERIELEITRLDSLIGQIIHWSKLSSGLFMNEYKPINLTTLIEKVAYDTDFEAKSVRKQVRFIDSDVVNINGSATGVSSAVENIIRNAIRFTPEDTSVEVRLFCDKNEATIVVRDYGLGVPDESLPMLFEPFYRVDETRGGDNSGSGLGMAICKAVIANHKGTIKAYNAVPGLEVVVTLPIS